MFKLFNKSLVDNITTNAKIETNKDLFQLFANEIVEKDQGFRLQNMFKHLFELQKLGLTGVHKMYIYDVETIINFGDGNGIKSVDFKSEL